MEINFLKIKHENTEYFLCNLNGRTLANICYVARRGETDEEGAIQRLLNKSRIGSISNYLLEGGFFPNNVVINIVKPENLKFIDNSIELTTEPKIAQIIDGQHRIEGIKEAIKHNPEIGDIQVPVLLAINLSTSKCAEIFVNINNEQKTVPKSLIYDLYNLIDIGNKDFSIERGTDIADILNTDEKSPYQGFVKFPGASKFKGGIQLSSLVSNLKPLVKVHGEFSKYSLSTLETQSNTLMNYFNAIQFYYGKEWEVLKNPFLFASGFGAAIDVFINKILPYGYSKKKFSEDFFKKIIMIEKDKLIYQEEVKGLSGEAAREKIRMKFNSFIKISETKEDEFEF